MARALDSLDAKSIIITSKADFDYDHNKLKVISSNGIHNNSMSYKDSYHYYSLTKFICIPTAPKYGKAKKGLNGLTSFVDAVVVHKPVLISDNTNIGIDVEGLGIGFTYKAGDANDMREKMRIMLNLSDSDYSMMCNNMSEYSKSHNYNEFCERLLNVISE